MLLRVCVIIVDVWMWMREREHRDTHTLAENEQMCINVCVRFESVLTYLRFLITFNEILSILVF